jgi:hypothetical protein
MSGAINSAAEHRLRNIVNCGYSTKCYNLFKTVNPFLEIHGIESGNFRQAPFAVILEFHAVCKAANPLY